MALSVKELDQFVYDELRKAFPEERRLPAGYDSIFWTGFKQDQGNCDIFGQILARPEGWQTSKVSPYKWKYGVVCMYCHDLGGDYLRGMRFPEHNHAELDGRLPFDCAPKEIERLVREAAVQGIETIKILMEDTSLQATPNLGV